MENGKVLTGVVKNANQGKFGFGIKLVGGDNWVNFTQVAAKYAPNVGDSVELQLNEQGLVSFCKILSKSPEVQNYAPAVAKTEVSVLDIADVSLSDTLGLLSKHRKELEIANAPPEFFNTLFGSIFIQRCKERNIDSMRER
jgi:hypothetical protein